jgi:excisionase family DNA binding protein
MMTGHEGERSTVDDELMTVNEVAAHLKTEVRFVRRLIAERRIPFHKVGKYVRFYRADVDAFVAAGRVDPISIGWHGGKESGLGLIDPSGLTVR